MLIIPKIIVTILVLFFDSITDKQASLLLYKYFVACETSPFAWFEQSFFQLGNTTEEGVFVCKKNCSVGYKLSADGKKCIKIPSYVPHFCPQANVMRVYRGLSASGRNSLDSSGFTLPPNLRTESEKESYINDYKKNKKEYYESCSAKMSEYDGISENVCSNLISSGTDTALQEVCYKSLCTNGKYSPLCVKLKNVNSNYDSTGDNSSVILKISKYVLIVILLSTVIYVTDKVVKSSLENKSSNFSKTE
jgi:hypothetical protein